jgi:hypothetical protein
MLKNLQFPVAFNIFCNCVIIKAEASTVPGALPICLRSAGSSIAVNLGFRHRVCWPEGSESLGSTSCEVWSQIGSFEPIPGVGVLLEPVGRTSCTASCEGGRTRTLPCSSSFLMWLRFPVSLSGSFNCHVRVYHLKRCHFRYLSFPVLSLMVV